MIARSRTQAAAFVAALTALLGSYAVAQHSPAHHPKAAEPSGSGMMQGGGMHEPMHGSKAMHGGMGCEMAAAADLADVKIEKTKTGAVIRLSAKDSAKVAQVQRAALMAAIHLGADASTLMPAAPEPRPAKH